LGNRTRQEAEPVFNQPGVAAQLHARRQSLGAHPLTCVQKCRTTCKKARKLPAKTRFPCIKGECSFRGVIASCSKTLRDVLDSPENHDLQVGNTTKYRNITPTFRGQIAYYRLGAFVLIRPRLINTLTMGRGQCNTEHNLYTIKYNTLEYNN
jgi:hypothetical protein